VRERGAKESEAFPCVAEPSTKCSSSVAIASMPSSLSSGMATVTTVASLPDGNDGAEGIACDAFVGARFGEVLARGIRSQAADCCLRGCDPTLRLTRNAAKQPAHRLQSVPSLAVAFAQ
jgi:hypothetical protein